MPSTDLESLEGYNKKTNTLTVESANVIVGRGVTLNVVTNGKGNQIHHGKGNQIHHGKGNQIHIGKGDQYHKGKGESEKDLTNDVNFDCYCKST